MTKLSRAKPTPWQWLISSSLIWLCSTTAAYEVGPKVDVTTQAQRLAFKLAVRERHDQDYAQMLDTRKALAAYPLAEFYQYLWLSTHTEDLSADEFSRALDPITDSVWRSRLVEKRRESLASQNQWQSILALAPQADDCLYLRAYVETAREPNFGPISRRLFETYTDSRHPHCAEAFSALIERGSVPVDAWQARAVYALERERDSVSDQAVANAESAYLRQWRQAQRDPVAALDAAWLGQSEQWASRAATQFLKSASRRDAAATAQAWQRFSAKGWVDTALLPGLVHRAARADAPGLDKLALLATDQTGRGEFVFHILRPALALGDYAKAKQVLKGINADDRAIRYWRQRLNQLTGESFDLSQFQDGDDYYAWAAAYNAGLDFRPQWTVGPVDRIMLQQFEQDPDVQLIGELLATGFPAEARRLWAQKVEGFDDISERTAAKIIDDWGWHERATATHGCRGLTGDVSWCFPRPYFDLVKANSAKYDVERDWIYSIMRQESRFGWDLGSSAGAQGLMQLMPTTAEWMAEKVGMSYQRSMILKPDVNIELGVAYLSWLEGRSVHRAEQAAAYNAGPGNMRKWLTEAPIPRDVWIETIPFDETREYVKRVLANRLNYCTRAGQDCRGLAQSLFAPTAGAN